MRQAMANAFVPGAALLPAELEARVARRARLLGPAYRLFYERPLHIVRGEGAYLYDADGVRYLDAYNNVPGVGHCHPKVVEALTRQAALLNTHTRYLHDGVLDYAERLLATMPPALGHVMFTCSGSEANDLALRIAQAATGGAGVIITAYAYHGVTQAVAQLSPCLGQGVVVGPHVRVIPAPTSPGAGPDVGRRFALSVRAAAEDLLQHGIQPAALLVDTVFTSDGNYVDPAGFLAEAAAEIRAKGGLFIADEVQAGFGRTGGMWGFSRHGLVPDLVTMGKPMGNGHPIAGLAAKPALVQAFADQVRYFNTFGGNPVSVAAANAVLDVLRDEGLMERAVEVGAHLKRGFVQLAASHPCLGEVRSAGLAFGVALREDDAWSAADRASALVNGLRARRILVSASGIAQDVLKIRPPLCFSREDADALLEATAAVLAELADRPAGGA